MIKAILGKKLGMSQIFREGEVIPVTVIETGPCVVVQKKTQDKDGYSAIQIGFDSVNPSRVNQCLRGHFQKHNVVPKRYLREVRVDDSQKFSSGTKIKVDIFKRGDLVKVTGVSKGKGFAGVVKRWGFKGGPASHGAGGWRRRPGSIGASSDPSRVFKGKKMPGRMGNEKVTVLNLRVAEVNPQENLLLVRGAVPGSIGGLLYVESEEG